MKFIHFIFQKKNKKLCFFVSSSPFLSGLTVRTYANDIRVNLHSKINSSFNEHTICHAEYGFAKPHKPRVYLDFETFA